MTKIQWCDETINPIIGCTKISAGCKNCYAEKMAVRLAAMDKPGYRQVIREGKWNGVCATVPSAMEKAYKWSQPRAIFVCSMGDMFHGSVPFPWIDLVVRMVWDRPKHTFIILTKRPDWMLQYFSELATPGTSSPAAVRLLSNKDYTFRDHGWHMQYLRGGSLPNLILGVTAENQETADERIPLLLQTPAAKRFVSIEPMVGPVNLVKIPVRNQVDGDYLDALSGFKATGCTAVATPKLDGVIVGGESAGKPRELKKQWVIGIRNQCEDAETPFMFKQWHHRTGRPQEVQTKAGMPLLSGRVHDDLAWQLRKFRR